MAEIINDPLPENPGMPAEEQAVELQPTSIFPPKPDPIEQRTGNPIVRFIISVLLFGAVYYFFFSKNLQAIAWIAAIIFIHELGHYAAMKIFKYEDLSIFFIPFLGAVAQGSKDRISQKEKAIVLLAGPVPGIIAGIILYYIGNSNYNYTEIRIGYIFVLLNLFNLVPVYPLDGGQLLKTIFIGSREVVSIIFIFLSVAVAGWYAITNHQWYLLIVPYFLIMRQWQQIRINKIRKLLEAEHIDYRKTYGMLSGEEYWRIRDTVAINNPYFGNFIASGQREVSDKEISVINYIKTVLKNDPLRDLSVTGIIVLMIIWLGAVIAPLMIMTRLWHIL